MTKGKDPRTMMGVRLNPPGVEHISKLAKERGEPASAVMRAMLAYASLNMPRDYMKPKPKPPKDAR